MFIFPDSVSRLVFQYPTQRQVNLSTQVFQFVGGGEQRCPISAALHQWQAQPVLLPDEEWEKVRAFFALVGGTSNPFQFTDLWDGTVYPLCYFKDNSLEITLTDQNKGTINFAILEGRVQP